MLVVTIVTAALTIISLKVWFERDRRAEIEPAPKSPAPGVGQDAAEHGPAADVEPASGAVEPVTILYDHVARDPGSRTPLLLRIFVETDGLTPEEIGQQLSPTNGGVPLTKHQARAVLRNLSRTQGHLQALGRLSREVLQKNFTQYAVEGAGRYGLSAQDKLVLRQHLDGLNHGS